MDVYFVLNGVSFVWNDDKAQVNPQKHDTIRIILARKATRQEREYYES